MARWTRLWRTVLVLAAVSAVGLVGRWQFRASTTATAIVRVAPGFDAKHFVLTGEQRLSETLEEAITKQARLVTSDLVIERVASGLAGPGNPLFSGHRDPIAWLKRVLKARRLGSSDLMEISLQADGPAKLLEQILQAIVTSLEQSVMSEVGYDLNEASATLRRFFRDDQQQIVKLQDELDGLLISKSPSTDQQLALRHQLQLKRQTLRKLETQLEKIGILQSAFQPLTIVQPAMVLQDPF